MPLISTQHLLKAEAFNFDKARELLDKQLDALPDVKIVSMTVSDVEGGPFLWNVRIAMVVEEV